MIRRLSVLLLALSLSTPAFAADASGLELVPVAAGYKGKATTVKTNGADISTDAFIAAIMDGDHYPMTATYMGVKALDVCKTLDRRPDGTVVVYQRTGGNFAIKSRQYVIALKVKEHTAERAEIEWNLVKHDVVDGAFSGPYAAALNAQASSTAYTPYNHGTWRYDKTAGTISYAVQSDPGGNVPDWLVSEGAVMAFPLELLKVRWGVTP